LFASAAGLVGEEVSVGEEVVAVGVEVVAVGVEVVAVGVEVVAVGVEVGAMVGQAFSRLVPVVWCPLATSPYV